MELNKFYAQPIENEEQRWLKFFKEGEQLDDNMLPDWRNTPRMRQAMKTLSTFSEKERQYFQYQARQEYLHVQQAELEEREAFERERERVLQDMKQAQQAREQAKQSEISALQEKQVATAEFERLQALLTSKN